MRNITYDISDLYNFMDGLTDLSALVYVPFTYCSLKYKEMGLFSVVFN